MTEYEYEYYSDFQEWPNGKMDGIQKIPTNIFVFRKSLEFKYDYYLVSENPSNTNTKNHPNTNVNTIRFEKSHKYDFKH